MQSSEELPLFPMLNCSFKAKYKNHWKLQTGFLTFVEDLKW